MILPSLSPELALLIYFFISIPAEALIDRTSFNLMISNVLSAAYCFHFSICLFSLFPILHYFFICSFNLPWNFRNLGVYFSRALADCGWLRHFFQCLFDFAIVGLR